MILRLRYIAFVFCMILQWLTSYGQECGIIYVTINGVDTGIAVGTKATPTTLANAFTLLSSANNRIHMASGTYNISNPIHLPSDVMIEGGFDPITWEKRNASATNIYRDNLNPESNPARLVALYGSNISNFRLQDLTVRVSNAFGGGTSTYAIHLSGCSDYDLVRCKFYGGNAGNGGNGNAGVSGTPGAAGGNGGDGDETGSCCNNPGVAPTSGTSFPGSNGGGDGGKGGDRGYYIQWFDGGAYNGDPGVAAPGAGAGMGGNGGLKTVVTAYPVTCSAQSYNNGGNGIPGSEGFDGLDGNTGTPTFSSGFFMPGTGTNGTNGEHGMGGGGGGGGGSLGGAAHDVALGLPPNKNGTGAGGGGGGEGGQGGEGGLGATGGGGSFGVYLDNNGANAMIIDCFMKAGAIGLGGSGGAGGIGGNGGPGGIGGLNASGGCNIGSGGNGGDGGDGGDGGKGGDGANGVSYLFYDDPNGTAATVMNINSLQQPFVYVKTTGCTNSPVEFFTTATGGVTWYFGAGSVPANAFGISNTAYYATTGRKTFTMVNNGIAYTYTDFIEIFQTGSGNGTAIQASNTGICEGGTASFSASPSADRYEWIVSGPSVQDTLNGDTLQTLANYQFDSAGTYTIILKTYDNCCGYSFPDTAEIEVTPIIPPDIAIQAEDTTGIFCDGATVTFSATTSNAGTTPSYQWQINGVNSGGNSSVFSTTTLQTGDSISCIITSAKTCAIGLTDTSNSLSATIISYPSITCSSDSFITGDPTSFAAGVSSGGLSPFTYTWNFGDSTLGFGSTVDHIYQEPGTYTATVEVEDANGCTGSCQNVLTISSVLRAIWSASEYSGCPGLTVSFSNYSTDAVTYQWDFGDGVYSVAENPTHTYNSPGSYDVTLSAFGGTGSSVNSQTNTVVIFPTPVANFQAYPSIVYGPQDTVHFSDNSINAISWSWNFGDPGSGANNTSVLVDPSHYYANNGQYTVTLVVTNNYGCTDSISKPQSVKVLVGMEQPFETSHVILFPNPFNDVIQIQTTEPIPGKISVLLRNVHGQMVWQSDYENGMAAGTHPLNISDLLPGAYILELSQTGGMQYHRILKSGK